MKRQLVISMVTQFQQAFTFIMYFHLLTLLWPYACVAATEFPELSTHATGVNAQSFPSTQPDSLANTTIPDNSTIGQIVDTAMHCATTPTWDAPNFHREDCLSAIDYLYLETSLTGCYSQPCTFYGTNANRRIRKDKAQPTPRMYTFGKVIGNIFAITLFFLQIYRSTIELL